MSHQIRSRSLLIMGIFRYESNQQPQEDPIFLYHFQPQEARQICIIHYLIDFDTL